MDSATVIAEPESPAGRALTGIAGRILAAIENPVGV